jgi:hypothetical protein
VTTRSIDRKGVDIDVENNTVVVRVRGERCGSVLLERVAVSASARLSPRCLARLAESGTGLLIMSGGTRVPSATAMEQPCGDGDIDLADRAICLLGDEPLRVNLARSIVAMITAQLALLQRGRDVRPCPCR